ncbi:MAG: acyl-ACP--UDP-N-acetylglucosamine O-acyltransferase [bacterium]
MRDPSSVTRGPKVHPTAVIHPSARLADGVVIGPYSVVEGDVGIGAGTIVGAQCVIHDHVSLGRENQLASHVVLGGRPQDRAYGGERTQVVIGDQNVFSEFASVDRATGEGHETRIGNGSYIMSFVKISHNCVLGDGVTVVSGSQIAGWVHIDEHAFLGGICGIHQYVHIGRMVMVGGMSGVGQDVPPYMLVSGARARVRTLNTVGLERNGVPPADREALRRAFRIFYRSGLAPAKAVDALQAEAEASAYVRHFVDFIVAAGEGRRGILRWETETES